MAEPYRSQISANPTPQSGASGEDFGAAIGRGLERAGAEVDSAIHRVKEGRRDQEATDAGVEFARNSTTIDEAAIDARATAHAAGAGHTEAVSEQFDKMSGEAIGRIRDPKIRRAFTERYAELREHVVGREYGWEAGARVDHLAQGFDEMGTTLAKGQAANPDAIGLDVSLKTIATAGNALAIPADTRDKLIKEKQRQVAVAWGNAMQSKNPHLLIAALDKGLLNNFLDWNDVNVLRDGGLVEQRRLEAADRAELARKEAAARERISTGLNKVGDGYVASAEEWASWTADAKTYHLEGPEWNLAVARDKSDVNRETRDWTPAQWHANVNALEAKGDKRTQAENVRLEHLHAAAGGAISRFNSDPFAAAAAAGNPAPQVDWEKPDAKAIEDRVTWARSYARSAGLQNVPYLSTDEMKAFGDRIKSGPAGQIDVAASMRQTFGLAAGSEILRQLDPSNKDLQIMVALHPRFAQLYREGVAALANKTVKLGADNIEGGTDTQMLRDAFQEYMPAIPPEMQPAVLNAARAITAGTAAEFGKTQPSGDELERTFRQAIQRAGGREGTASDWNAKGGFAEWNGHYAWLPPTISSNEFVRRISRADGPTWERAAGSAPYYMGGDGKLVKMNDRQVAHLKDYSLETVSPGLYRMTGPDGGHVVDKDGRPWQFDVSKLGSPLDEKLAVWGYVRR